MNDKIYEYETIIHKVPNVNGAYVEFPYNIKEEFGKGRVKVHVSSIVNMGVKNDDGTVCYIIGLRKDIREKIGKQPGDRVTITAQERQ